MQESRNSADGVPDIGSQLWEMLSALAEFCEGHVPFFVVLEVVNVLNDEGLFRLGHSRVLHEIYLHWNKGQHLLSEFPPDIGRSVKSSLENFKSLVSVI